MRIILLLFVLCTICFSCERNDTIVSNNTGWIVNFPDSNLALAIREVLDKPIGEITRFELLNIKTLTAISRGIVRLDGIGFLNNLEYLDLSFNAIIEIEDIASLTKLRYLSFLDNKIIKVDSLRGLTELRTLKLDLNAINDISFLAYLPNLSEATLSWNYIGDIYPIFINQNYGEGDGFDLRENPLGLISKNEYIPALIDRGVLIVYSP